MRYLLDTNIVSDLVRNPQGKVTQRIRKVGETQVCTSIVVAAELRYGAAKKGSPRLAEQLEAVLGALEVLPLEPPVDAAYGSLRTRLEQAGTPIGANDLLIAAHAITKRNSRVSRTFNYRIGCAKRRMLSRTVLPKRYRCLLKSAGSGSSLWQGSFRP
jgi:tRNA(fMet)-specific endonuclease VapC